MPGKANRHKFSAYLKDQLPDLKLTRETEDFFFSQFDVNRDGFFESHEILSRTAKELESMGKEPNASNLSSQILRTTSLSSITPQSLSAEELSNLKQKVKASMAGPRKAVSSEAW